MKAEKVQELPRLDARGKVTGRATYVEDLPDLPGMTWGAVLLSPYSHARIVSIDASPAQRLPGVLGVLDREHLEGLNPMLTPSRPCSNDSGRWCPYPVAVVRHTIKPDDTEIGLLTCP